MAENGTVASPPRLLTQMSHLIRAKHYSWRTETSYIGWARCFILFHGKRHPREMGRAEIEAFLSRLVVGRNVAANTQNQALAALLFLYKEVLGLELPWMDGITRAKKPQKLRHPHGSGVAEARGRQYQMIYKHVLNRGVRGVVSSLDGVRG